MVNCKDYKEVDIRKRKEKKDGWKEISLRRRKIEKILSD